MTGIEWTDRTWNPVTGCDRISPGCDHCYALTMAKRLKAMGQPRYQADGDPRTSGPGFGLTLQYDTLGAPLRWQKPSRVFVNSMSDLFHRAVSEVYIASVWATMAEADWHTFQILTKRADRMAELIKPEFPGLWTSDGLGPATWPLPNVWLGVSVESDRYAFRADHLRSAAAAVRFISCEPLLGRLPSLDLAGIDWLIIGCESGPGARFSDHDWARELVAKARAAGTAVFVKQLTKASRRGPVAVKELEEFPEDLRIREYPHA